MKHEEINRRFCELAGIRWHERRTDTPYSCSCGEDFSGAAHFYWHKDSHPNPDFCADPRLVSDVMKGRKDYLAFLDSCLPPFTSSRAAVTAHWVDIFMDKTGQLALKAIEWMEEQKPKAPLCDGCLYKNNNWYCDNYHNRNKCTKYVLESKT